MHCTMICELMFRPDVNETNVFDQEGVNNHGVISRGPLTCRGKVKAERIAVELEHFLASHMVEC